MDWIWTAQKIPHVHCSILKLVDYPYHNADISLSDQEDHQDQHPHHHMPISINAHGNEDDVIQEKGRDLNVQNIFPSSKIAQFNIDPSEKPMKVKAIRENDTLMLDAKNDHNNVTLLSFSIIHYHGYKTSAHAKERNLN